MVIPLFTPSDIFAIIFTRGDAKAVGAHHQSFHRDARGSSMDVSHLAGAIQFEMSKTTIENKDMKITMKKMGCSVSGAVKRAAKKIVSTIVGVTLVGDRS